MDAAAVPDVTEVEVLPATGATAVSEGALRPHAAVTPSNAATSTGHRRALGAGLLVDNDVVNFLGFHAQVVSIDRRPRYRGVSSVALRPP